MLQTGSDNFAVELKHVNHYYGSKQILYDLNLRLPPNRIYGLLGRNGAGKTTLINLLSAQIFPSFGHRAPFSHDPCKGYGEALIFGHKAHESIQAMKRLCVVREKTNMPDSLRISEALRTAAGFYPAWDKAYAAQLIEKFSLEPVKKYKSLSRGMESALGLVIGLASRADLTIFDEPSLGLDAAAREYFYAELIHDVSIHPRTVIISTHMIDEVARLFEDVVIMDKGRIKLHMSLDELMSRAITVAGQYDEVVRQTAGLKVLHEETLGSTLEARSNFLNHSDALTPIDLRDRTQRASDEARVGMCLRSVWAPPEHKFSAGVELYQIPLQKLFVYLTEGGADI